jgi:hypothetical protein
MTRFFLKFFLWLVGTAIGFSGFFAFNAFFPRFYIRSMSAKNLSPQNRVSSRQRLLQLPFSEEIVHELEGAWEDLPSQAQLVEESHGWRIMRLEPESPIAKAGYHQGDLIPNKKIDASLAALRGDDNVLAQRIFKVLKRLSN